jgi:hypothetical protein
MVSNSTFCGIFTRILKSARVLTNLVDTFLLWWTIRIRSAFYVVTTDVRIPFESNWTCADRFMSYSSTIRITSTGQVIRATNWGAFTFSTSMSLLTLAVRLAANNDTGHLRISIISRLIIDLFALAYLDIMEIRRWPVSLLAANLTASVNKLMLVEKVNAPQFVALMTCPVEVMRIVLE